MATVERFHAVWKRRPVSSQLFQQARNGVFSLLLLLLKVAIDVRNANIAVILIVVILNVSLSKFVVEIVDDDRCEDRLPRSGNVWTERVFSRAC